MLNFDMQSIILTWKNVGRIPSGPTGSGDK